MTGAAGGEPDVAQSDNKPSDVRADAETETLRITHEALILAAELLGPLGRWFSDNASAIDAAVPTDDLVVMFKKFEPTLAALEAAFAALVPGRSRAT